MDTSFISCRRTASCFLRDSSLWHFFEWPTQLSPLLSKTSQLSTLLSKSARLSPFLSAQKSILTLESTFLSGFTLLSAQKSAQKSKTTQNSAQKSAQATPQPTSEKEQTQKREAKRNIFTFSLDYIKERGRQ